MYRTVLVSLILLIASCSAAPEERAKRHGYDYVHGGYSGGHGYGGHGYGGHQGYGGGGGAFPLTQTFSQSKATASASSSGGSISG